MYSTWELQIFRVVSLMQPPVEPCPLCLWRLLDFCWMPVDKIRFIFMNEYFKKSRQTNKCYVCFYWTETGNKYSNCLFLTIKTRKHGKVFFKNRNTTKNNFNYKCFHWKVSERLSTIQSFFSKFLKLLKGLYRLFASQ